MSRTAMRTLVITVVVLGFLSILASVAFDWPAKQWIAPLGYLMLAVGLVIALVRRLVGRSQRSRRSSSELSASDDYSDLQLGRRPITHYPRDEASTSQVGDPPQERLPPL